MGKLRDDARYVLERMEVEGTPRVYVLGCNAKRVTVMSQQYRAFNLIWALFADGHLKGGDRVGVVGGGIGGLTTAGAAMLKGCNVVLTEERQELMHLQRRNTTRLLHPNIYEWPLAGAEEESTHFPCMNWSADIADQVVASLDEEWNALVKDYHPEVQTETRVTDLRKAPDGRFVLVSEHWESDPCDIVVVAVGFGVEPPTTGLSIDSYWENDKLEQPVRGGQSVKRYLISGLGDGACIDVLRLKYSNFHHGRFATTVSRLKELDPFKRKLLKIDLRMPAIGQAEYLRAEYQKLSLPPNLASQLGTLRTDTHVLLNGSDAAPLSPRACILHRVAIWSLVLANKLDYRPGRLNVAGIETRRVNTGLQYMVPLPGLGGKYAYDGLVIRHGPRPCLGALSAIASGYKGITDNPAKDRTRSKRYPDDFYPHYKAPPRTSDDRTTSVTRSLDTDVRFEETPTPPLVGGGVGTIIEPPLRSPPLPPGTTAPAPPTAEVLLLTRTLAEETRAQNYPQAANVASLLEGLLTQPGTQLSADVSYAANKALWNFELFVRERVRSGGEAYDLARLKELLQRMERGNASAE